MSGKLRFCLPLHACCVTFFCLYTPETRVNVLTILFFCVSSHLMFWMFWMFCSMSNILRAVSYTILEVLFNAKYNARCDLVELCHSHTMFLVFCAGSNILRAAVSYNVLGVLSRFTSTAWCVIQCSGCSVQLQIYCALCHTMFWLFCPGWLLLRAVTYNVLGCTVSCHIIYKYFYMLCDTTYTGYICSCPIFLCYNVLTVLLMLHTTFVVIHILSVLFVS